MILDLKRYKLVIIDYPIHLFDDPVCSDLLARTLRLKYDGYSATYHSGILPMDKSDFFSRHLIFCEEIRDKFIPIFAYKSTTLARCLYHGLEFPPLTLLKNDGHMSCVSKINEIIKSTNDPERISYDAAWAEALNYRLSGDRELKQKLKEVMITIMVMQHQEFNLLHMFCCGAVKVKTDKFFLNVGLNELNENAHFIQKGLDNEESVILHLNNKFSEKSYELAEKNSDIWKEKIHFNGLLKSNKKAA